LRRRIFVTAFGAAAIVAASSTSAVAQTRPPGSFTDAAFCVRVQQRLAGTRMVPENTVFDDLESFTKSKTAIDPLRTYQYTLPDPADGRTPWRVSCKVKTPDHLNAHYGPGTANDQGITCKDINRDTVAAVLGSLLPSERARAATAANAIIYDPDTTTIMGNRWLEPYDFAYTAADGHLHLFARNLRVNWDDWWFAWAPERFRGAYYCHLAAPEYVRRLLLGDAKAPRQGQP
jgi:hypothetical protein